MRKILFAVTVLVVLTAPAGAAPGDPTLMSCSADRAQWKTTESGPDIKDDRYTQSWSCTVNGMTLLVRAKRQNQRTYHCGATAHLYVSAWANGVKVVKEDDAGDVMSCFGNPALTTITLGKDGTVRVCHQKSDFFEGGEEAPVCEENRRWRGQAADPNYALRDLHTTPALLLPIAKSDFCAGLAMNPDDRNEAIKEFLLPSAAWRDVSRPEGEFWQEWSAISLAHFDIDNDGKPDEVFRGETVKVHGNACCALAWRPSGTSAQPFVVQLGEPSDWVAFDSQPVRIAGRSYVYTRRVPAFDWDDTGEIESGTEPTKPITRAILELRPDGTSTTVCGWAPKPRPEEFL